MASENAKAVANEVIETVRKGKKVVLRKILPKHGYSKHVANSPTHVTETESFKSVIDPIVEKMKKERERAINAMSEKDLTSVQYDKLSRVSDELTKNIQLLTGGKTENTGIGELTETLNAWINSKK